MLRGVRVAIVCSAHGLGHASRQVATARELAARGARPTFFSAAPAALFEQEIPEADVVPWQADVGLAQADGVSEDVGRTLALLEERAGDEAIDRLASALSSFDRVLVDVAPTALEAARRAGRRAVAVGNFDWAWVYRRYPALAPFAERFRAFQAPHEALELWPGPGMHGFSRALPVGLLGQRAEPVRVAPPEKKAVLVAFGGFGLRGLAEALPELPGVAWVLAPPLPRLGRPDCVFAGSVPFRSLIAGADAVLTKPGYGTFSDCALAGVPMAWLDRGSFPEAPSLESAMRARGDLKLRDLSPGAISDAVLPLLEAPRPPPLEAPAAPRIAAHLLA